MSITKTSPPETTKLLQTPEDLRNHIITAIQTKNKDKSVIAIKEAIKSIERGVFKFSSS